MPHQDDVRNIAQERDALIAETSRLAFEIEAAQRHPPAMHDPEPLSQLRRRASYHAKMAELLALTVSWHPAGQAKVEWARRDHLRLADSYERSVGTLMEETQ